MGIFDKMKRDYRNAGAKISLSLHFAEDLEHREKLRDPWLFHECTGLELHNSANVARKDFLKLLNSGSLNYRPIVRIPEDYWRLAVRALQPAHKVNPALIPDQMYPFVCNATSLIAESAFAAFEDGDGLFVFILAGGEVWVERLAMPSLKMERSLLGNITGWPGDA